jgi:hypothetical protein
MAALNLDASNRSASFDRISSEKIVLCRNAVRAKPQHFADDHFHRHGWSKKSPKKVP